MQTFKKKLLSGGSVLFIISLLVFYSLILSGFFPYLKQHDPEGSAMPEALVFYTEDGDHYFREMAVLFEQEHHIPVRIVVNRTEVTMRKARQESSLSSGSIDCVVINSSWQKDQLEKEGLISGFYPLYSTESGFIYDSETLIDPPGSWSEFTHWISENPGQFGFAATGGTSGFSFLYSVSRLPDFSSRDSVWAWFRSARENMLYTSSDYDSLRLLSSGKMKLISDLKHQMLYAIDRGELSESVRMYVPEFGSLSETYGLAIPSNTGHSYNTSLFVQFLLKQNSLEIMKQMLFVNSVKSVKTGLFLPHPDARSYKIIEESFKNQVLYY